MRGYLSWTKKQKKELLKTLKEKTKHIKVSKRYFVCGSRICDYWTEKSDIDIAIVCKRDDLFRENWGKLSGEFVWHGLRVFFMVQKDNGIYKKNAWRYWGGYHLPRVGLETDKLYKGNDLEKYIAEQKSNRKRHL